MTNPVIPAEVVEVAVRATYEAAFGTGWELEEDEFREDIRQSIRIALEAAAPYLLAHLLAFADERDNALGAIRSHITTYELRTLLGVHVE